MHDINTEAVLASQHGMPKAWFGKRPWSVFLSVGATDKSSGDSKRCTCLLQFCLCLPSVVFGFVLFIIIESSAFKDLGGRVFIDVI